MNVISRKKLEQFWDKHPDAKPSLKSWYNTCRKAHWRSLDEVHQVYPQADAVGDCTVFNIGGNKYRLIARIVYRSQTLFVIAVLTHEEYDLEKWKE